MKPNLITCILSNYILTDLCLIRQKIKIKKIYFKQLPVPFKIYADFECIFKKVDFINCASNGSYTRKYQDHIPCSFAYKVDCIDNKFSRKVVLYRGKDAVYKFIEAILSGYNYCRKIMKKHFNKSLIMSAAAEERLQLSNICWICDGLFDVADEKVICQK